MELEGARTRRSAFYRSLIRSDERLDYPQVDRIFAGAERAEEPWARAARGARAWRPPRSQAARGRRARWPSSPSSREFAFDREGHVVRAAPGGADRVAPR